MGYQHFPTAHKLAVLRGALKYEPSNKQQPLLCVTDFEGVKAGKRPGFKSKGGWLIKQGDGQTYLRNIVWRVLEGSIPSGFKVEAAGDANDNRIVNLYLKDSSGNIRVPKSVAAAELIEIAADDSPATLVPGTSNVPTAGPTPAAQSTPVEYYSGDIPPWDL